VLLLLVLIGPMMASKLRLPGLVGMIVLGMLVGPNVLGVVSGTVLINALGFVGLLYLMFQGGLDLDLDGFVRRRRESIIFGTMTFVLPMLLVTAAAYTLDVPFLAAVIIASALTSHTPLSYPTIARFDLSRNRAVTATLGATLLATVAALLVLAVAAAAAEESTTAFEWLLFGTGLVLYVSFMLGGMPRITRWFFQGPGQDRDVRLTYLLSGMGFAAVLAGALGIEPIVGAFLAGLAFNRFVPAGTLIADRVEVLGRSLFVPAFLISTGMMLDPVALVTDPRTLLLGGGLVAAEVVSKWGASSLSGRFFGFSAPERGVMFSLSVGQAAGALAAVVVGQELGLLGPAEVNAVILVIMVSALLAGLSADRHAPRIEPPGSGDRRSGPGWSSRSPTPTPSSRWSGSPGRWPDPTPARSSRSTCSPSTPNPSRCAPTASSPPAPRRRPWPPVPRCRPRSGSTPRSTAVSCTASSSRRAPASSWGGRATGAGGGTRCSARSSTGASRSAPSPCWCADRGSTSAPAGPADRHHRRADPGR
jgi:Kef-type K+ transport system membrane component KefB